MCNVTKIRTKNYANDEVLLIRSHIFIKKDVIKLQNIIFFDTVN